MEKLGTNYGGWIIPKNINLNENSIVYSGGVGEDISFDIKLQTKYGCNIILIDPTEKARKHFIENTWEHKDYKLMRYIPELRFVEDYIRDFFKIKAGRVLEPKDYYVNILEHLEQSYSRNNLNLNHLLDSSNYTMIYCVDVTEKSSSIVIEYDDHLRINKLHQVPIKNNKFIIMPSTLRYFISENLSEDPNIFINITYRAR